MSAAPGPGRERRGSGARGWRSSTCSGCSPRRTAPGWLRGSARSSARSGELVEAFRPRVTFTRFIAPPVPAGAWQRYYDLWPFARQPPDARIYELVDDFAARRGQTLDAVTFGKWGPELSERVGDGGRLVLAGVSTDCCVLSTALAAADAGAEVQVVADACAGVNDVSHGQALDILRLYSPLIEVVSLADVLGR